MPFDLGLGIGVAPSPYSAEWGPFVDRWRDTMTEVVCPLNGDKTIYIAQGISGGDGTQASPFLRSTPEQISALIAAEHPGVGQRLRVRLANDAVFRPSLSVSNPTTGRGIRAMASLPGPVSIDSYFRATATVWDGFLPDRSKVVGGHPLDALYNDATVPTRPDAANFPNVWKIQLPAGRTWHIEQVFVPSRGGFDRQFVKVNPASLSGTDAQRAAIIDAAGVFVPVPVANTSNPAAPDVILRCGGPGSTKTRWDRAFCYDAANDALWIKISNDLRQEFGASDATFESNLFRFECGFRFPNVAGGQPNSGIYLNAPACRVHQIASVLWGQGDWATGNTQTAPITFHNVASGCATDVDCFYSAAHTLHVHNVDPGVFYLSGRVGLAQSDLNVNDAATANGNSRHSDGASLVNSFAAGGGQHMLADVVCDHGTFFYDNNFACRGRTAFGHSEGGSATVGLHVFRVKTERGLPSAPRSPGALGNVPQTSSRADLLNHAMVWEGCRIRPNGQPQKAMAFSRGTIIKDCDIDIDVAASSIDPMVAPLLSDGNDAVVVRTRLRAAFRFNLDEASNSQCSLVRRNNTAIENQMDWVHSELVLHVPDQPTRPGYLDGRLNAEGQRRTRFVRCVLGFQGANNLRLYRNEDTDDSGLGDAEPFGGGFRNCAFYLMQNSVVPDLSESPVWGGIGLPADGPDDDGVFAAAVGVDAPPGTLPANVYDIDRGGYVAVQPSFWDVVGVPQLEPGTAGGVGGLVFRPQVFSPRVFRGG